ncbi:MAG: aminopeptidase P family protein [Synergistaceae bacterium]|nr:aminopeptidase P family protein [Synergistaceae bacterium]
MNEDALKRTEKLRIAIESEGAGAFVIINEEGSNWESLYYMSGFRGTAGALIVFKDSAELMLDSRYAQQGREQSPLTVTEQRTDLVEEVRERLLKHKVTHILCEAGKTNHSTWEKLAAGVIDCRDGAKYIKELRRTKDAGEIESVRRAAEIGASAFLDTLGHVKPGMTEKEFEALLNYKITLAGGEVGFDMIVASGTRSAMPHGRAGDKKMCVGEWVTVDFGARWNGYFCDITRNFSIGEPDARAAEIHELLLKTHKTAADKIREGTSGTDVHNAALKVLEEASVGQYFTHGLGHGFGLEIHEAPYLSSRRDDILKAGDVVTVEPGVYIEGWGGLRLEDDYLVTKTGAQRLTDKLYQCFYRV